MSSFIHELSVASMSVWVVKATFLLAVAWGLHVLLRSANPRWHVCLWRTTLVGLVGLPVLALVVPNLHIDVTVEPLVNSSDDEPADSAAGEQLAALRLLTFAEEKGMRRLDANSTDALRATEFSDLQTVESTADQSIFGTVDGKLVAISNWLTVAGLLLLRLILGSIRIRRLIRNSVPGESRLIDLAAGVMEDSGLRQLPDIRTSTSVSVPFVAGLIRPVVVLPAGAEHTVDTSELKLILTHELGHVAGRDVPWAMLACIVRSLMWFHPLVWRLPSAHQVACETVCDALATRNDSTRVTYRSLLAKLALLVNCPYAAGNAVSMSATAEITRRLRRLEHHIPSQPLSRRRRLVAMTVGLVSLTTIAAITQVPRVNADETPAAKQPDGDTATTQSKADGTAWVIRLKAIDADTGTPIANPEFTVQLGEESTHYARNDEGAFSAAIPSRNPRYCYLKVRASGYTPMRGFWANRTNLVDELPEELTFRMTRGITVGGTVLNEEAQPVPGATVWLSAGTHVPEERIEQSFHKEELTTDQHGQWRCSIAPREMNSASIKVDHPEYAFIATRFSIDQQIDKLKALSHSWTLKEGFVIRGIVTGPDGSPVEGAHLAVGTLNNYHDNGPFAVTDAGGRYEFRRVCASIQSGNSQRSYSDVCDRSSRGIGSSTGCRPRHGRCCT